MKIKSLLILSLSSFCLISCAKEKPAPVDTHTSSEAVVASQPAVEEIDTTEFKVDTLPTIAVDSSAYPFIQLPTMYKTQDEQTVEFEKFYFGINGKPTALEGKLYTFGITTQNSETKFSDTLMIRSFQEQMQKLGAKKLNDQEVEYKLYEVIPDYVEKSFTNIGLPTHTYGFKTKDGKNYVIQLGLNGPAIAVMEVKPFDIETQAIVPSSTSASTNSKDLAKSIADTGKATVHINFAVNDAKIEASSQSVIDEISKLLHDNKDLKIEIHGHTDNTGNAQNNLKLSEKRAQSVRAALIEKSIPADRLQAKGFGQNQPVASNDTEDGKAQNRRVELIKIN